jgi:hypothetical protein
MKSGKSLQRTGPKLKSGRDAEAAETLIKWEQRATEAIRVIFDTGLFCYWIKSELPQGQFGAWLHEHAPKLCRDGTHGSKRPNSTLSWHMDFTKRLIESGGYTVERVLKQLPGSAEMRKPELFLLAAQNKVPTGLRELHAKISERTEGKTAYQLYLDLKQSDDDGNPQRGRLKGCKGTTREQREAARERQRQHEIEERSESAEEWARFTMEQCDNEHLGDPDLKPESFQKAFDAYLLLKSYLEPLAIARGLMKGAKR